MLNIFSKRYFPASITLLRTWVILLVLAIGVCTAISFWNYVPLGDDLGYNNVRAEMEAGKPLWRLWGAHWLHVNGRLPNYIFPWVMQWQGWGLALFMGILTTALFGLTLLVAGLRKHGFTAAILLVGALLFTLPWWDSFMLVAVRLNYIWGTVFALATLTFILRGARGPMIGIAALVAFLAGCGHESIGVSLLAGIIAWLAVSGAWRNGGIWVRIITVALAVGTCMPLSSPALWARGAANTVPDAPWPILLGVSCYWGIILWIWIGVAALTQMLTLRRALNSPWIIFPVSCLMGIAIVGVGGIIGRSGFFCQIMGLAGLFSYGALASWKIPRIVGAIVGTIVSAVIIWHLALVTRLQVRCNEEMRTAIAAYLHRPGFPVMMDYTRFDRLPAFTLGKVRTIPELSETYLRHTVTRFVGDNVSEFVVIPRSGGIISHILPSEAIPLIPTSGPYRLQSYYLPSTQEIAVEYEGPASTPLYYIAPVLYHPGDHEATLLSLSQSSDSTTE